MFQLDERGTRYLCLARMQVRHPLSRLHGVEAHQHCANRGSRSQMESNWAVICDLGAVNAKREKNGGYSSTMAAVGVVEAACFVVSRAATDLRVEK